MNCSLHKITYPTFRILLLDKLFETIYLEEDVAVTKASSLQREDNFHRKIKLSPAEIPLSQVKNATFLAAYQSAIALKLASGSLRTALALAYQVVEAFHHVDLPQLENSTVFQDVLREFTVNVTKSGYLEFVLSDQGLVIWLQFLIENPPQISFAPRTVSLLDRNVFLCQHAHARCVTLIRLAEEAGIQAKRSNWTQNEPYFSHPAERDLIFLTISVLDSLYDASATHSSQTVLKWAIALAQAFQRFQSACRIVSEPSPARLGLVMVTQGLLRSLLQEGLGVCAPAAL
jgi:DALR anticodon binding domain